jgi:hypothetical protein
VAYGSPGNGSTPHLAVELFARPESRGTPPAAVEKLNAEIRKALAAPDVKERLVALGAEVSPSGHQPRRGEAKLYVGRILPTLMTLAHFSVSAAISFSKSAEEPGSVVAPRSEKCSLSLALERCALTAPFSFAMISAGVALGATRPPQPLAS